MAKYCFENIIFLTFDVNGINAFQKVFIFEASATLPGKETFGGIQKVFVFLKQTLSGNQSKLYGFPMFSEQETIWISNDFRWVAENTRCKNKCFLRIHSKHYGKPMILKHKTSLGVMVFAWFSKRLCFKIKRFLKSTKSAILELMGKLEKYLYFQCFCEFQKPGFPVAQVGKKLYF